MSQDPQIDPVSADPPNGTLSSRPRRACTLRAAQRMHAPPVDVAPERRRPAKRRKKRVEVEEEEEDEGNGDDEDEDDMDGDDGKECSRVVTELVAPPEPGQLARWNIRSMWELASVLNFLHVFRPLLNIQAEFSVEELETALMTPNDTLSDIHMPLLKAIPPVIRMALTRDTWITVLCRKLRDWWHWVAEGEIPVVASHGVEIEVYKSLDPGVRVVILKALCDIRVEQEDIRSYIDNSLKHGVKLSAFRKERAGGDSRGISYWYEDDPVIGHRLYREIRKVDEKELSKGKTKGSKVRPNVSYQWETVATNLDEFQDVSEKLFSSKNRTEASLGKKLKNDMLSEIEKIHKRKERLLKKQHREALLLDNCLNVDGLAAGRSLRGRKPVTYTFDDFDRSINEAIKITKEKRPSPDPMRKREVMGRREAYSNGKWSGPSHASAHATFSAPSPSSVDCDDFDEDPTETLERSSRRKQRPQRYSEKEFIEDISENEADFDSDDDIVGEVVYDEEYLKKRKQRKNTSSSSEHEEDEEYRWDDDNAEDDDEEEDPSSFSEESDEPRKPKKLHRQTRRETKLRSVGELQSGLRRSKRATRNRIDYRQYELFDSETETEAKRPKLSNTSVERSDTSENVTDNEYSEGSQDSEGHENKKEVKVDEQIEDGPERAEKEKDQLDDRMSSPGQNLNNGKQERHFLDLNELAPGPYFDDGPSTTMKDEDRDNF